MSSRNECALLVPGRAVPNAAPGTTRTRSTPAVEEEPSMRTCSNHSEVAERPFDRWPLVVWARHGPAMTGAIPGPFHGEAVQLLDVSDPARFRDESEVPPHVV